MLGAMLRARAQAIRSEGLVKAFKRRRGAALVEMALVIMILVLILLGIMDIGYVFFVQHNMVNAARDAARTVAVRDGTAAQATTVANQRLNGIPLDFNVNVTVPDPNNPADKDVGVTITTPLNAASFGLMSGTLRADVTMRKEGGEE